MVLFAGKTVWSMPERFECTSLARKALYKYSSFPFLSFPVWNPIINSTPYHLCMSRYVCLSHACPFLKNRVIYKAWNWHESCPHSGSVWGSKVRVTRSVWRWTVHAGVAYRSLAVATTWPAYDFLQQYWLHCLPQALTDYRWSKFSKIRKCDVTWQNIDSWMTCCTQSAGRTHRTLDVIVAPSYCK